MNKFARALLMPFLSVLFLLPLSAQEKPDTTICIFRFLPNKDIFYVPYAENGKELDRLIECVNKHKDDIVDGKFPIYVDGYCNARESEAENLEVAKIQSNRVKSEVILRAGVKEENFITSNHAMGGNFVTVCIAVPGEQTEAVCLTEEFLSWVDEQEQVVSEEEEPADTYQSYKFSLRFNLLRWLTLTPDLGIEWRASRTVGILLNASNTSWTMDEGNYRYALWEISPELRFYLGEKKKTYLGAMYKVGSFNYKLSATGIQGDINGGGITGGYFLQLNKSLVLDFGLGLGYLKADTESYELNNGVRTRTVSEVKNWWGPIDARISLVWKLF